MNLAAQVTLHVTDDMHLHDRTSPIFKKVDYAPAVSAECLAQIPRTLK